MKKMVTKKMKKPVICALALVLALMLAAFAGCSAKTGGTTASDGAAASIAERGLAMTRRMGELAASEAYRKAISTSGDLATLYDAMGACDFTTPRGVYKVTVSTDAMLKEYLSESYADISETVRKRLNEQCYSSIITQVIATNGATSLAAAVSVADSGCFVNGELKEPVIYLYIFDGEYSSAMTFTPGEDGAVSAAGMLVKNDLGLSQINGVDDAIAWMTDSVGAGGVSVEVVKMA